MRRNIEIISGQRSGCLTVLREVNPRRVKTGTRRRVEVICDCGAKSEIDYCHFERRRKRCKHCPTPAQQIKKGEQFGRRTVISDPFLPALRQEWFVTVQCECGTVNDVPGNALLQGSRQQCNQCGHKVGWDDDPYKKYRPYTEHPIYGIWMGIKNRIYNVSDDQYENYGGRGLDMLAEWRSSFGAFAAWVEHNLGPRPSAEHSVDRIDNDYGYFPTKPDGSYQLRWATQKEQNQNRRSYRRNWGRWCVNGIEGSLFGVCKQLGIADNLVKMYTTPTRNREGMNLTEALRFVIKKKLGIDAEVTMLEAPTL